MSTQTRAITGVRRFVDPEDLICAGCGEQVRCAPLAFWRVSDGLAVPQFSHLDRSALCRVAGTVAEVIEVT